VIGAVTLSSRAALPGRLDAGALRPDRVADLDERHIARLPVWVGRRQAEVGDFFDVRGGRSAHVRIEGALAGVDALGRGMTGGHLLIDGDAGAYVAAEMAGGEVEVRGRVGDDAGIGLSGGTLRITGGAGDRLGGALPGASAGMRGGEIVAGGSAGREVASRCRRGLVVVGGSVGVEAARAMIAGTLVVLGAIGVSPGRGNKRGSLVAAGSVAVPPTYQYACTFEPPWLRLLFRHLEGRYGLLIEERVREGQYARYCGDAGDPGRGEILVCAR
jgi:formylmethanofuran dehydrogenase subunit C